jgi:hypothetical protein
MSSHATVTNEHLRILLAVDEQRFRFKRATGRYEIEREEPPDRKSREQTQKRGYIRCSGSGTAWDDWTLTTKGCNALLSVGFKPLNERRRNDEAVSATPSAE